MTSDEAERARASGVGGPYAWYVLVVLVLVYVVNFIDRQIMSILAEDIKADLGVTDTEMGFLYGTAFAVFYALFGIPLGRLADNWVRTRLLSIGLALWSSMTALSGFAQNFGQLALARVGVGIGEASAGPSAFSMLSDWFPKEKRATALAIYSSGLYIGGGISLLIGAAVVNAWDAAYPNGGPLGLAGWHAAFVVVGLPGLLLALWVATLREPVRGMADGLPPPPPVPDVWARFRSDLASVLPPFTLFHVAQFGAAAIVRNLVYAAIAVAIGVGMWKLTGDWPQWLAICIGGYAVASWAQSLKERDAPTYALIWQTPSFLLVILGFGSISFVGYALSFWAAPYAIRTFIAPVLEAGGTLPWYGTTEFVAFILGGSGALGGFIGIIIGGALADRVRRTNPAGRILVSSLATIVPAPFVVWMFTTDSLAIFLIANLVPAVFGSIYVGIAGATSQDLVLPRMRGAATATYFIGTTLVGLGLGPYFAGKMSVVTGSLATGALSLLAAAPVTLICLYLLYKRLPEAEATRIARARAAGEVIEG